MKEAVVFEEPKANPITKDRENNANTYTSANKQTSKNGTSAGKKKGGVLDSFVKHGNIFIFISLIHYVFFFFLLFQN